MLYFAFSFPLLAIIVITAGARQFFVLRHTGNNKPLILLASIVATLILAYVIAPTKVLPQKVATETATEVTTTELTATGSVTIMIGAEIIQQRCLSCHSATPSDDVFTIAPLGVVFDTPAELKRWAPRIKARAVDTQGMPIMNKTQMTQAERVSLGLWLEQGMPE